MANTITVPGSSVPSGANVSPGGAQGVQGIQGPTAVSANAGNQATLGTDNLVFVPHIGQALAIRVFTASGTYTPTTGMVTCIIECVGGGGGGGPITGASNMSNGGGGGGGGGYSRKLATAAQIGASQTVTIGAGGGSGANGGNTSVGSLCLANGGLGAPGMGGNYGGSVTGAIGDLRASGGCGVSWAQYVQGGVIYNSISGCGGSSFFGGGGPGAGGTSNGNAGQLYGGGGGGGCAFNSATTQTGGAGAAGVAVITEYA